VVRSGHCDPHHQIDDAEEAWSEHVREAYPDDRASKLESWFVPLRLRPRLTTTLSLATSPGARATLRNEAPHG
jgi:hypothetical protein